MSAQVVPRQAPVGVVRFAATPGEPITLQFIDATLEVLVGELRAIITPAAIAAEIWAVTGIYVLLGSPSSPALSPDGEGESSLIRARPGRATDLLQRQRQHAADPEMKWASRALLARDTRQGFNSAQAGYLEGRLHKLCRESARVEHIGRLDRDDTLQEHERAELDRLYLPHIGAVLELVGMPVMTYPEQQRGSR